MYAKSFSLEKGRFATRAQVPALLLGQVLLPVHPWQLDRHVRTQDQLCARASSSRPVSAYVSPAESPRPSSSDPRSYLCMLLFGVHTEIDGFGIWRHCPCQYHWCEGAHQAHAPASDVSLCIDLLKAENPNPQGLCLLITAPVEKSHVTAVLLAWCPVGTLQSGVQGPGQRQVLQGPFDSSTKVGECGVLFSWSF